MVKSREFKLLFLVCAVFLIIRAIPFSDFFNRLTDNSSLSKYLGGISHGVILVLIGCYLISTNNLKDLAGLSFKRFENKYLLIPPLLILVFAFSSIVGNFAETNHTIVILFLIQSILLGLSEELFFRGLVQSVLIRKFFERKNAIMFSVVFASLVFAGLHLVNTIRLGGIPLDQLIYSFFAGIYLGSLLLLTGQILPIGIFHGLVNFLFMFNQVLPDYKKLPFIQNQSILEQVVGLIIIILFFSPLLFVGIWQIKRIDKEKISRLIIY